jgi:endogenous inhibitor of DNA gyrase (YacG/DUF329 family)
MSITYIHEGGQLGDFDFLYEVLEKDKVLHLAPETSRSTYWKRERVGPFCSIKKSTPTGYLYERLKDSNIRSGSKLDDALIDLSAWAEREVVKLGHNFLLRDEL